MRRRPKATDETASVAQHLADRTLVLKIIGEVAITTHPLPEKGELIIGRSREADISIDDPSISRRHARLILGDKSLIGDLESRAGVKVRGRLLDKGELAELATGEIADLGVIMILLQRGRPRTSEPGRVPSIGGDALKKLEPALQRVAAGEINVLVLGETGVGKEVLAEAVHRMSPRADKPLLRLNCGALSESLIESELFGHEKGAFTGADQAKRGLLETADGGSIFLDEVGDLPLSTQVKLLRVIEERRVMRVGSVQSRPIDVRFIAATNRNLEEAIAGGAFRADLFYRLNGFSIVIPPLRDRTDEIPALTELFAADAARKSGKPSAPTIAPDAMRELCAHRWPGNIRELRNVVERAVLLADDVIEREHLPLDRMRAEIPQESTADLKHDVDVLERRRILDTLEQCGGNQTRAARTLGISRTTLVARLNDYGVVRPRK